MEIAPFRVTKTGLGMRVGVKFAAAIVLTITNRTIQHTSIPMRSSYYQAPSFGGGGRGGSGRGGGRGGRGGAGGMDPRLIALSKGLSWLLRHGAVKEGLAIREDGSILLSDVLAHRNVKGYSKQDVLHVIQHNDKQRFELIGSEPNLRIRARQGHSQQVGAVVDASQLMSRLVEAPPVCVHGTYLKHWQSIKTTGLHRMTRQHIHFTDMRPRDGQRTISGFRGDAEVLIYLDAAQAMADGCVFFESSNGVILTEGFDGILPTKYFSRATTHDGTDLAHDGTDLATRDPRSSTACSEPVPAQRPVEFDGSQVVEVGEYVFFWQPPGVFSQWTPSHFEVGGAQYDCCEMYMMAEKARLFGDEETRQKILAAKGNPKAMKALGRQVRGFEQRRWDESCSGIVIAANLAKFEQNHAMRAALLATGDKVLVEASPYDAVWGIGLRADHPDCCNPAKWRGANKLGQALMEVRRQFQERLAAAGQDADARTAPAESSAARTPPVSRTGRRRGGRVQGSGWGS